MGSSKSRPAAVPPPKSAGAAAAADAADGASPPPPDAVCSSLAGPADYKCGSFLNTHVTLTKGLYKPGETVYGRAILIDSVTHAPLVVDVNLHRETTLKLQVKGPKGDVIHDVSLSALDPYPSEGLDVLPSVAFSYDLPASASGGDYEFLANFSYWNGTFVAPRGSRSCEVRAYRPPRLKCDLDFLKQAYGAGERVLANLCVTRAEGGHPVGAVVTAVAVLDGVEIHRSVGVIDMNGCCGVRFDLPPDIPGPGEGSLSMSILDGGVQESAVKTIPIPRSSGLELRFYPEGGDLCSAAAAGGGNPSTQRVYVEARTAKGRPADVKGKVFDSATRRVVAEFITVHEGRCRFDVPLLSGNLPQASYYAELTEPSGILDRYPLGNVSSRSSLTLRTMDDVVPAGQPLRVEVGPGTAVSLQVAIKGHEIARSQVAAGTSQRVVEIPLAAEWHGILRLTMFDAANTPLSERLTFRKPLSSINVSIEGPEVCGLREKVIFTIKTHDENGGAVDASVCCCVVDDAAVKKVERRDRAPRLVSQALIESDVKELRDFSSYFSSEGEGAPEKMDLLLGCQGWRRFIFSEQDHPIAADLTESKCTALAKATPVPGPRPLPPMRFMMRKQMNFDDDCLVPCAAMPPQIPCVPGLAMAPMPMIDPALIDRRIGGDEEDDEGGEIEEEFCEAEEAGGVFDILEDEVGELQEEGGGAAEADGVMRRQIFHEAPQPPTPTIRREYAHKCAGIFAGERYDFEEVLFWMPDVRTKGGVATVEFDLCDSITSFEFRADAISTSIAAMGEGTYLFETRRPFYVEPKLPLEVTEGDIAVVPIASFNGTAEPLDVILATSATAPLVLQSQSKDFPSGDFLCVKASESSRSLATFTVAPSDFTSSVVTIKGRAGLHSDSVRRSVAVAKRGFPMSHSFGGKVAADGRVSHSVMLPKSTNGLVVSAKLLTSPAASLESACASMLQEPCGCFEQTSSSAYPNIMVLKYLLTHSGVNPELVKRAQQLLDAGLKRLTTFECKEKGYEWFGGDPGHEALTAYGLMEFTEMGSVTSTVDPQMLERTRNWLMSRRDGKGGFLRNPRALDDFGGAGPDTTNCYITWALSESGVIGIEPEVDKAVEVAMKGSDLYVAALASNICLNRGDHVRALPLLTKIAEAFDKAGGRAPESGQPSITGSTGSNLCMETTSLAILAFVRAPDSMFMATADVAFEWVLSQCKGGRFGATQATILALKAVIAVDAVKPAAAAVPGTATLSFCGASASVALELGKTTTLQITSGVKTEEGGGELVLSLDKGFEVPYALTVSYTTDLPPSSIGCPIGLTQRLGKNRVTEGETVDLDIIVKNSHRDGVAMTVAIIGIPGGLEARADQLRELVKERKVDCFELRGREVVLYWRGLAGNAVKPLSLSLLAAVPGSYTGPASRAYLYYGDDAKEWREGLEITIDPT